MLRKLSGGLAVVVGAMLLAGAAGADDKAAVGKNDPPYVHAVIFYLKKEAPASAVPEAIADAHKLLEKIPSVRKLWVGRPAEQSTPDFAKKDYDFGLLVLFDNYEGLKAYLDHPQHLEYVKKHAGHFNTVLVYDFINQAK
jgi:hypothetical protein